MKKYFSYIIVLLVWGNVFIFSQTQLSVPLNNRVYELLDYAHIKGLIDQLPTKKPYAHNTVLKLFDEIFASGRLTPAEYAVFEKARRSLVPAVSKTPIYSAGKYRREYEGASAELGGYWTSDFSANLNAPSLSQRHWLGVYAQGDIGPAFSYKYDLGMGLMRLRHNAYPVNTYSKDFDAIQILLTKENYNYAVTSEKLAAGIRMEPELALSLYKNKIHINFSRVRRDWGAGDGNIILSKTARPFIAADFSVRPLPWLNFYYINGILEFLGPNLKTKAEEFQLTYGASSVELLFGKYGFFNLTSSVLYPKRSEMGYWHPALFPVLYQFYIGDFDNMQLGLAAGGTMPKYLRIYASVFTDELNFLPNDFFHKDRNMYVFQAGIKGILPFLPLGTAVLQYTKVEPYMYTHPLTDVPWYNKKVDTTYINHGEPLGYKADPNSDELKVKVSAIPLTYLDVQGTYTMVRHGTTYGNDPVDGSSFADRLDYSGNLNNAQEGQKYYKNFLRDGTYQWIHSLGIVLNMDVKEVLKLPLPLCLSVGYTLSYSYHTDKNIRHVKNADYKDLLTNYLSLSFRIY
ncbi:hypothetical protein V1L52_06645 [Treponema sp. HNW]|uniref:hypothetical protein n=1 Tax=Treponema sp. HNW TaxID=3116654 RepID=UPI003D0A60BC